MGFFDKIKAGLKKTRDSITGQINSMLHAFTKIDEELFEELEELLVMADVGMNTATEICDTLRARVKERGITDPNEIMTLLQEVVTEMVSGDNELHLDTQPSVILVIGVNGVGKTTTIGKLASRLKKEGKSVILGAADTFRAAAIEQLEVWAERADVPIIKHAEGADPAAVVYDTISAAKARHADVVICGGIGGGAQSALTEAGIRFYGGVSGSADAAVQALLDGSLGYDPEARCDHHDHAHGAGHTCGEHGCGEHSCHS